MMKKLKKQENKLIYWWKKYFKEVQKAGDKVGQRVGKTEIRDYARTQLDQIEEAKPDKNRKLDSQLNDEQLEYVKWLRWVADTGELENEIYGDTER